ncbi:uncharacterized protein [Equus caballus]|uniref:uncharacterized protein n=1 Tax=Equus caballus TaxID=9796 RepID=UPI0038B3654E
MEGVVPSSAFALQWSLEDAGFPPPAGLENTRRAKVRGDPPPPAEFRRVCLDTRRPPARKHDPPEHPDHCHPPHSRRGRCSAAFAPLFVRPCLEKRSPGGVWGLSGATGGVWHTACTLCAGFCQRGAGSGRGRESSPCVERAVERGKDPEVLVERAAPSPAEPGGTSSSGPTRGWRPRPGCAPRPGPAVRSCPGAGRGGDAAGPAGLGTRRRSSQKVPVSLPRAPQARGAAAAASRKWPLHCGRPRAHQSLGSQTNPHLGRGNVFLPYSFGVVSRIKFHWLDTACSWTAAAERSRTPDKSRQELRVLTTSVSRISAYRVQWKQEW